MEQMMNDPMAMNEQIETLSGQEMEEAQAAMGELLNMIAEMRQAGMSDEEINQFLSEFGITLEEVLMADQALRNPGSMTSGAPEMEMGAQSQIQSQLDELKTIKFRQRTFRNCNFKNRTRFEIFKRKRPKFSRLCRKLYRRAKKVFGQKPTVIRVNYQIKMM